MKNTTIQHTRVNMSSELACLLVSIVGLLILISIAAFTRQPPLYDEPLYLDTVELLHRFGLSVSFLNKIQVPAGPLYALVHFIFEPLTHLEVPGVRSVNIIFLLLTIAVTSFTNSVLGFEKPLLSALSMVTVPMTWVISGLALTEMPAMFFASLGILLLMVTTNAKATGTKTSRRNPMKFLPAAIGGLAFGLSILGRQPFLVVLIALAILIRSPKNRAQILIFLSTAIILPTIIFSVWGGLVPPQMARVGEGFAIHHGILSYAYAAFTMLIFAPKWFSIGSKSIIGVMLGSLLVNVAFGYVEITPAYSLAQKFLPEPAITVYTRSMSGLMVGLGLTFLISSLKNMWINRKNRNFIFLCASALLICATPAKITHLFSSRYTATAIPLLLLVSNRYTEANYWKAGRMLTGSLIGFLSLWSYFWL